MRKLASMLFIGALWWPGIADALGLGELTLRSFLNEPLQAEVELLELGELDPSQVKVRLATREDFSRAGVDRDYFLTSLRFVVQADGDSGRLVITSTLPVREPFLNFIVEARWPTGRLLREYTVLLDPPVFVGSQQGITARGSSKQGGPSGREPSQSGARAEEPVPSSASRADPGRSFGAGATDSPISGSDYMVQRDDTLWRIAQEGRPAGFSVQQTMLDIQRLNPEAFIGGNINRLKAGYVLRLPTADEITPRSFEQAVAEVAAQQRRWQRGVSDVETRLDASESLESGYGGGADRGAGHLQIAAAEGDAVEGGGEISAQMEDLDRARRENADLSTRLGSLEQQLQMQERLISLKDEQIAALQEALARSGGEAAELPTQGQTGAIETGQDSAVVEPGVGADTSDATAAESGGPAEGPVEDPVIDAMPDAGETAASQPPPEQVRPTAPVRTPQKPSLFDMLMENILYVGAGLLLLLLAILYLLRNRLPGLKRGGSQPLPARAGGDDEDEFAGVRLSDDSLIVDEFAEDADRETGAAESIGGFSAPDEEAYAAQFETGDALAEADIYIAYGRFPQAVDLLKTAISVEPANTDYRMKLMEACIETVDREEFQQQYADLEVIGDEHVLARARDLLDAVDGGEVWLEDLPEPAISQQDVAAAMAAARSDIEVDQSEESLDLGLDEDEGQAGLEEEFDLDLDLDEDSLEDDLDQEQRSEGEGLDLDHDDLEQERRPGQQASGDDLDLDLDLGLEDEEGEGGLPSIEREVAADAEAAIGGLEELELEEPESEPRGTADLLEEYAGKLDEDDSLELTEQPVGLDIEDAAEEVELPDLELDSQASADDGGLEQGQDELLSSLDELDLELDDLEPSEGGAGEVSLDDLDFSLDDDDSEDFLDLSGELEAGSEFLAPGMEDALDSGRVGDDTSLAMDLEPSDETPEPPSLDSGAARPAGALDEELLDLAELGDESELDGAEFSLEDFDAGADIESMELDMSLDDADDEGLVYAANGDEVATKLDLARAYLDMGDHDGARNILGEVIQEGSEAQQAEAKSLLEGID